MESRQFRLKKIKSQIRLFLPLALLMLALMLVGWGQFQNPLLVQFKMALKETVAPIVRVVSAPVRWGEAATNEISHYFGVYQENKILRAENEALKNWRNVALQLQAEQQAVQHLMGYVPPAKSRTLMAKVLTDDGGRFSKSLVVSAGSAEGIKKGDVAMTNSGVIGRIVTVGRSASRLLLLTDYASRVPVIIGPNQVRGILSGDGSNMPKIISLPENKTVSVGDVVLTSGQVGVFPTGLGIGVVDKIHNEDIKVRLFEENMMPYFVRLVDFGLGSVLLDTSCQTEEVGK